MQHVEEAGVHSGDSACVLPAPSLDLRAPPARSRTSSAGSRRRSATVGLINVQLAVHGAGDVLVLEANPRASPHGAVRVEGDGPEPRRRRLPARRRIEAPRARPATRAAAGPGQREGGGAALRALSRSDPVLGPEMRSTGEVMALGLRPPDRLREGRARGRPAAADSGLAFLSVRDADKPALVPVAAALAGLGFKLAATAGTARALEAAGLEAEHVREGRRGRRGRATSSTSSGAGAATSSSTRPSAAPCQRTDGYRIRRRRSSPAFRASPRSRGPRPPCTRSPTRGRSSPCRFRSGSTSKNGR